MYQSNIATLSSVISTLTAIVGIICFFFCPTITIICGIISIINSIIQNTLGAQRSFGTEIATVFIGIVLALIFKSPIFTTIFFLLCCADIVMLVSGWIYVYFENKRNQSYQDYLNNMRYSSEETSDKSEPFNDIRF